MLESRRCPTCGEFYWPPTQFCQRDGVALLAGRSLLGQLLDDRYRIESLLGVGGMGTVYRAVHVHLDSAFAVKVLHPEMIANEAAIERFRREAKAARRIQHRNAIAVTDFGVTADKLVYLVMEFVEGQLLRELIQDGPFEYRRAVNLLTQMCAAVEAAHRSGVVHRDLKPDNIIVQQTTGVELVKVLDFGIAKLLEGDPLSSQQRVLTKAGMIIGTPQYMSPEQCQGKELERGSDIYSLGIIAYELLSGETPFVCEAQLQYISKHLYEVPPPLRSKAPRAPLSLERVIMQSLEKDPANRFSTAEAFAEALRVAVVEADEQLLADEQEPTKGQHIFGANLATIQERPTELQGPLTELIAAPEVIPAPERKSGSYTTRLIAAKKKPNWLKWPMAAIAVVALCAIGYFAVLRTPQPSNDGKAVTTVTAPPGMVLVKGGTFTMGRDDGGAEERPAHKETVRDFFLDQYEVTNAGYEKFVQATNHRVPAHWVNGKPTSEDAPLPVTNVTWTDAMAFAKWAGKRLPTEIEWEYAARGGEKGYLFPWGNEWKEDYANSNVGKSKPSPGGAFDRDVSSFMVYDLMGNVSEWVGSDYVSYETKQPISDCVGCILARGGSYETKSDLINRWSELRDFPQNARKKEDYIKYMVHIGFRCAK